MSFPTYTFKRVLGDVEFAYLGEPWRSVDLTAPTAEMLFDILLKRYGRSRSMAAGGGLEVVEIEWEEVCRLQEKYRFAALIAATEPKPGR